MSDGEPGGETGEAGGGPLSGLKVLELCQLIAGPFCGQLLGDLGADVLKVEAPGQGDPLRVWGREDYPLLWSVCARNKRSVTINLREPEGQALVRRLAEDADILVENFRPGTMEKWGLGYDALSAENPRLIMVRISGYGQTGPYAGRPGYASVGEAMGGLRYLIGEPDRKPARAGISIGDTLAGTFGTLGALAALEERHRSGRGQVVDASIFESVLAMTEALVPEWTVEGVTRERSGAILPGIAPSNIYDGRDGMVIIAGNQDTVFARLCAAIGRPELSSDPRFIDHAARGRHQGELDGLINDWTRTRSVAEIEAAMVEHSVPVGRVYRAPDMLDDPHYAARGSLVEVESDRWGAIAMQGVFPRLSRTPGKVRWSGRHTLGEDTEKVLAEQLGLDGPAIEALRKKGVI